VGSKGPTRRRLFWCKEMQEECQVACSRSILNTVALFFACQARVKPVATAVPRHRNSDPGTTPLKMVGNISSDPQYFLLACAGVHVLVRVSLFLVRFILCPCAGFPCPFTVFHIRVRFSLSFYGFPYPCAVPRALFLVRVLGAARAGGATAAGPGQGGDRG